MNGYIKLYRKILDNPIICKDSDHFAVWNYLLLNATHKEMEVIFKGKRITLKKGQLITGRKVIAEKFTLSESKVERILKTLKSEQQIEQQTSTKNRLITILNWELYQESEQQIEQQVNNNRTTSEQQVNTNKNDKNVNNDKNERIITNINIYEFLEKNFGRTISPVEYEKLLDWENEFTTDIIQYAIELSCLNNAKTLNYIVAILQDWKSKGFTELTEIKDKETKKTSSKLPEWFDKEIKKEEVEEDEEYLKRKQEFIKKIGRS